MINTNQPESAFPSTFKSMSPEEGQVHRWGMTLRDYFAAKAMEAFCSDPDWRQDMMPDETARAAYNQANEMLKARDE
jgi:hypothetical protein